MTDKQKWTARPVEYDGEPNGEWEVVIHDPDKPNADDPWFVAAIKVFDSCDDLNTEETARLIAAAPELYDALAKLEPYLDAIICYASTMDEHEPNRLAFNARAALSRAREV